MIGAPVMAISLVSLVTFVFVVREVASAYEWPLSKAIAVVLAALLIAVFVSWFVVR